MKVKILGTRGEIESSSPYHSKQSGILIDNELLIDLGEREFLKYKPRYILFTHLHPDHAFFKRPDAEAEINIPMFAPESYRDDGIEIKKRTSTFSLESYYIRPIPTIHSQKVQSQAYVVTKGKKRILYTGDLVWIKKWYNRYFKDLDLIITEGSFIRKDGMVQRHQETGEPYGHSGVPRLVSHFSEFSNHIVLIHFGNWFYKDIKKSHQKVKKLAMEHNIQIDVGYDGMELEI